MQVRFSRVAHAGKVYRYPQLVESYRKSDGSPTHRVLASLKDMSELEVENLRTALQAGRERKRVEVALPPELSTVLKPLENLQYLDVAVLLELWSEWGLPELLAEVMPDGDAECSLASVVTALVLHRCVDPGSKLAATRWFPRSCLPELQAVRCSSFNNTRLHRVLDELYAAGPALMGKLPERYLRRSGAFCSLFLDVTDTWFVGDGPEIARTGKTKEGFIRKKIGIVLLCNEHGYPLRWEVIPGNCADSTAMTEMMRSVAGLSWASSAPIVVDRAMGHSAQIRDMAQTGLRFLTALTVNEFENYSAKIPHAALAQWRPSNEAGDSQQDVAAAAALAATSSMTRAEDDLYVVDLGTVAGPAAEKPSQLRSRLGVHSLSEAMRVSREVHRAVREGIQPSYTKAGESLGLSKSLAHKYGLLRNLAEDIQNDLLAGRADGHLLSDLLRISKLSDPRAQRESFDSLLQNRARRTLRVAENAPEAGAPPSFPPASDEAPTVRAMAYFNPTRFVEKRKAAKAELEDIEAFVVELNTSATNPRSRSNERTMAAAIDRKLRRLDLLQAFDVQISSHDVAGRACHRAAVKLIDHEWARRRRYDGFTVLVCHTALTGSAAEMCRLYRAKDAVEKGFQTIKSVVEVRPLRHRTEAKVRAHVTICMLALLLKQIMAHRLDGMFTSECALELLRGCHLNRYAGEKSQPRYLLTHLNKEQRAILKALRMTQLADDEKTAARIKPR